MTVARGEVVLIEFEGLVIGILEHLGFEAHDGLLAVVLPGLPFSLSFRRVGAYVRARLALLVRIGHRGRQIRLPDSDSICLGLGKDTVLVSVASEVRLLRPTRQNRGHVRKATHLAPFLHFRLVIKIVDALGPSSVLLHFAGLEGIGVDGFERLSTLQLAGPRPLPDLRESRCPIFLQHWRLRFGGVRRRTRQLHVDVLRHLTSLRAELHSILGNHDWRICTDHSSIAIVEFGLVILSHRYFCSIQLPFYEF